MFFSEQELSVKIGVLDVVWICDGDHTFLELLALVFVTGGQTDHGKVLDEFAADGTTTDQ